MKNTDFMNLSLPEGTDKIDVEVLNNDFTTLENEVSKHYIKQQIEVDGTATIIGSVGPYVQLENLTDNILNVSIGDELVVLMKGDNRKIRTISGENYGVVTNGAVKITYFINARTYADENFYKKEKVDELLENVEGNVEVDTELSETSENPVQNKVITQELASYATTAEVESKVTEKVAEIVAGAPERYNTLKELADWIDSHEDSAASMNSAIQQNKKDISTANTNITKNAEDISTANTNIQKNVDDISNVNVQIADIYNRCSGGKNVFDLKNSKVTNWGNAYTKKDDSISITGSSAAYARTAFNMSTLPTARYNVSFTVSDLEREANTARVLISRNADGTDAIGTSEFITDNGKYTFWFSVTSTSQSNYIIFYGNYSGTVYNNKLTVSKIMVYPEKIKDDTYIPYVPTNAKLQEQINTLLTRIEALESAATTTTEGGE